MPDTIAALARLRAEPGGVAEAEAFRLAVKARFGSGRDLIENLATRVQYQLLPLSPEIQSLMQGGEAYGRALLREPRLDPETGPERKPAVEPERDLERKPARGLGLGL